tara:strand:- start:113 stop:301 length:189 start_codon:yes stop_codon:yes gene_type:complete
MSYQITCVNMAVIPNERMIVKTVDTFEEAVDYCTNRNLKVGADYMGKYVYHYFEKIVGEDEE